MISILLLSWLVSKDTSPWDAEDVENELGLTVVGSIEQLPSRRRQDRSDVVSLRLPHQPPARDRRSAAPRRRLPTGDGAVPDWRRQP